MRIQVEPARAAVIGRAPLRFTVAVTNTSPVIAGYRVRVLGLDPSWVEVDQQTLSLFPDASGTITVTVRPPTALPAGEQRFSIQVRELTPPHHTSITDVYLDVPAAPVVRLRADPPTVTAGRRGSFGLLVENRGNTRVVGRLAGRDDEEKIRYRFVPATLDLPPGEHAAVELRVSARRRILGQPVVRPFRVVIDDPAEHDVDEDTRPRANASFMQRPVLSRGMVSLVGLLASVTVFALVITYALSNVVGRSAADRDLALQVAQAQHATAGGSASASGSVRQLTSGAAVPGVDVSIFAASDTATPLASAATDKNGGFRLADLGAGSYKLRFRAAGFADVWYPQSLTDADATEVTVQDGQDLTGLNVRIGGLPATISGKVLAAGFTGAQVALQEPGAVQRSARSLAGAVLQTVPVGSDGSFAFANVPSPSVYDLVVTEPGYATQTQRVDVGGGEDRSDVQIQLQKGDGSIAGHVTSSAGAVPDATIAATYDQTTVETVSDADGAFTLESLPTPGEFTVVVSAKGFASQTLALSLTSAQHLTGVGVTLGGASGSLAGSVTVAGAPAPGVTVTVSNGVLTVTTVTATTGTPGAWQVHGLSVPSTYTITFARDDLAPQTLSTTLDAYGTATLSATSRSGVSNDGIHIDLTPSTATLSGVTREIDPDNGTRTIPVGEVAITLSSGNATYTETSASVPAASLGAYEFDRLPPGTYTVTVTRHGSRPTSSLVTLSAAENAHRDLVLGAAVRICGVVTDTSGTPMPNLQMQLYRAALYPKTAEAQQATADDGTYCFNDLDAPDNYIVELDYPAVEPYATQRVSLRTKAATVNFTVKASGQ